MKNVTKVKKPKQEAEVGKKIEYARTRLLMSQETLAEKIGRKRPELTRWETGERKIDVDTLKQIAITLGVSTDYLLGINDIETSNIDSIAINKITGLSDKAIKVLTILNERYHGYLISTINYLIEQEMLKSEFDIPISDSIDYGRIEDGVDNLVGINTTNIRIISKINKYFKAKINDKEVLYLTNKTLRKANNNDKEAFDTEEFIYSQEVADVVLLKGIEKLLEDAKRDIIKSEE